jgi:hypothetical protein
MNAPKCDDKCWEKAISNWKTVGAGVFGIYDEAVGISYINFKNSLPPNLEQNVKHEFSNLLSHIETSATDIFNDLSKGFFIVISLLILTIFIAIFYSNNKNILWFSLGFSILIIIISGILSYKYINTNIHNTKNNFDSVIKNLDKIISQIKEAGITGICTLAGQNCS